MRFMQPSILLPGMLCLAVAPAMAQAVAPARPASPSCVDVSVNDRPALSYACLNQRLAAAAHPAPQPDIALDAVAHAPGNQQVGQFNFSAFSHQMGDSLGKSVIPQRPPPVQVPPLVPVGAH
jgi:hypothetical protein